MKDKKKLIVVGALVAVILCVGVFQFVVGGTPAPAPEKGKVAKKEDQKAKVDDATKVEPPKNPLFAADLPARDPFQSGSLPADPKAAQPATPPKPQKSTNSRPDNVPVLPPMQISKTGGLAGSGLSVQPEPEAKFSYTVSGVMLGGRPMAVFNDSKGEQRLVLQGGSLDPESKVVSIDKDAVTVRFHGKTLRLTVEGNPNAK